MKKKITCYVPFCVFNVYAENIKRLLSDGGYESYPIKKVMTNPLLFFRCKVFNFNWFEEARTCKEYYAKMFLFRLLKFFRKKIVFTLHNRRPHETSGNEWSYKLTRNILGLADIVIGLCPETEDVVKEIDASSCNKLRVIPHPNYIFNYDYSDYNYREKYNFGSKDIVFLFLGAISPYKNIDLLIDIFETMESTNIKLLIAGNPANQEYGLQLKKRIDSISNVYYDFRMIPDEEIAYFYNTCNIVVLPYKKDSYLNSGAAYLSFSLRKTVICPVIGTIKMLEDKSFVYDYDYEGEDKHKARLYEEITKVIRDVEHDPLILKTKGNQAYDYIKDVHSDEKIALMYKSIYDALS